MSRESSTRRKITAGYILLTLLLIATMGYIYSEINILGANHTHDRHRRMRRAISSIMSELNKAEIMAQAVAIGEIKEYRHYKQSISNAKATLDTLLTIATDSTQLLRIDSVTTLLEQKESNMHTLLKTISEADAGEIYYARIDSIIHLQDSLLENISRRQHRTISRTQSQISPAGRKGFFKRLSEVFSPQKPDTIIVTDTIREAYTAANDTIHLIADTIANILERARTQAADNQARRMQLLRKQMHKLQLSSLMLNEKVAGMLATIEKEEQKWYIRQEEERESMRQNSAWVITGIATAAVMIAALFLLFIRRDMKNIEHYRKELEKARQRAEELLSIREKLMLTITHDIKTPTGSILGYCELLGNTPLSERQMKYLQNMQNSANHLLRLINSLLDFYRLDSDKMEITPVTFNAKSLLDSIIEEINPQAERKNLAIIYNCERTLDDTFTGDPLKLRQIIENLTSNAIKFTGEGSITIEATFTDNTLHVKIKDTGCGISPNEKEQIFKEFTRLGNAQGKEGFGLGLSIVNKLTHLMKGSIDVESTLGEGSTFHVSLPLKHQSTTEETKKQEQPETALPPTKLILIDDDPLQLQMTKSMLNHPALHVTALTDAATLLNKIKESHYDIIITDIQMPAINGIELMAKIREIPCCHTTPIIAMTARNDIHINDNTLHKFSAILYKPFTRNQLFATISATLPQNSINPSALTEYATNADEAAEIINTFIEETKKKREALIQAQYKRDIQTTISLCHQLLPLFKMIGAEKSLPHLEYLDKQRGSTIFTDETAQMIDTITEEAATIIEKAARYSNNITKHLSNE
ncbi:MAG: response regulator [Bacteroidaceae bacterium]|nr:response regulator [Bacteroidaceae bacterium]